MRALVVMLLLAGPGSALGCGNGGGSDTPGGAGNGSSSGSGSSSSGGADGGASSSGSASGSCEEFSACGGDVVGEWTVETICFENPEVILPITQTEAMCADALRGVEVFTDGSYTFTADGEGSTDLVFSMELDTLWSQDCVTALTQGQSVDFDQFCAELEAEFAAGVDFTDVSCAVESGGCGCLLGIGEQLVMSSGPYQVQGDELALGTGVNPFCVDGDTLRISVTSSGLTGTFLLRRM